MKSSAPSSSSLNSAGSKSTKSTLPSLVSPPKVSLLTYDRLVGESDGGTQLPADQWADLLHHYKESWANRQYVTWVSTTGRECRRVKRSCRCLCGHSYKAHCWWDVEEKVCRCRCPDCHCSKFLYVPHQGSWDAICVCGHSAPSHTISGVPAGCSNSHCSCTNFSTTFRCLCGDPWSAHTTTVQSEEERKLLGLPVDRDTVQERLRTKKPNGCGRCVGCKCMMTCSLKDSVVRKNKNMKR